MFLKKLLLLAFVQQRSYRRKLLDELMFRHTKMMQGVIDDLAGKNTDHRGKFRPPDKGIVKRIVVNLDPEVKPDILADICETGLDDAIADCVILTETLQHAIAPKRCVAEAYRLLKPGGVFIGSVPFLYPVHRDPVDIVRIGPDGLTQLLSEFTNVEIYSMGQFFGVLGLFLERKVTSIRQGRVLTAIGLPKIYKAILIILSRMLIMLDRNNLQLNKKTTTFTTGYFFIGTKQ